MQVDATIKRLQQVQSDAQTYAWDFHGFVDGDFPLIGDVNIQNTHDKVIVPYIEKLMGNLHNRFGDAAGQISVASNIFNTSAALMKEEEQLELEMWANAERDGRPGEYRWRPLRNDAKFG